MQLYAFAQKRAARYGQREKIWSVVVRHRPEVAPNWKKGAEYDSKSVGWLS